MILNADGIVENPLRFEDGGDAAEGYVVVCVRVIQDRQREKESERALDRVSIYF